MAKELTTKEKWIIAGVVLLLITLIGLAIYFNGKAAGKRKGSVTINTTPTDPGGSTSSASQTEIKAIASELYQDMKGANWTGHDVTPWKRWLALSDTDFIRVGNEFNQQYQTPSGETIGTWVAGEQGWTQIDWTELKNTAVTRLAKLKMI